MERSYVTVTLCIGSLLTCDLIALQNVGYMCLFICCFSARIVDVACIGFDVQSILLLATLFLHTDCIYTIILVPNTNFLL